MKKRYILGSAIAGAIGLAAVAVAASPGPPPHVAAFIQQGGPGAGFGQPISFIGGRIVDQMEGAINPTDAQKVLIADLRSALERAGETGKDQQRPNFGETQDPSVMFDHLEGRMEDGLADLREVRPAAEALYASLSDEQRETLAELRQARMSRFGPRMGQ